MKTPGDNLWINPALNVDKFVDKLSSVDKSYLAPQVIHMGKTDSKPVSA
jgi:hypothetical protein